MGIEATRSGLRWSLKAGPEVRETGMRCVHQSDSSGKGRVKGTSKIVLGENQYLVIGYK